MARRSDDNSAPVYENRSPEKATEALTEVLQKLKLRDGTGGRTIRTSMRTASCESHAGFLLNQAPDKEIVETLTSVQGLGTRSVNRIIAERTVNGDFLGPEDFDRRVKGVRFASLESRCSESNIALSLSPSSAETRRVGQPTRHKRTSNPAASTDNGAEDGDSLLLATWNTGRMSLRSTFYEQKVGHLVRFVSDSSVDVLLLQELCRGVARDLCLRLMKELGSPWQLHDEGNLESVRGDHSLGMLYRSDRALVSRHLVGRSPDTAKMPCDFQRMPQVSFLRAAARRGGEAVGVVHVHLHQMDPRAEIARLADVVGVLERHSRLSTSNPVAVIVGGDFNLNADSVAFEPLRQRGMIEMVRPAGGIPPHPYKTLSTETTVGGHWYDNFWVTEGKRRKVLEAWCFEFGGRRRNLLQSGYEFAAEKRASSSDHLPLVIRIRLDGEFEDLGVSSSGYSAKLQRSIV